MNFTQLLSDLRTKHAARRLERFPPLRNLRIQVLELGADWRRVRILLPLSRCNRNPGGSMFGGAVACLADPIPALACNRLFPGHGVWTRRLEVDFVRPGTDDLVLRFAFSRAVEERIARELAAKGRSTPDFEYGFYLPNGEMSARIRNWVAIRPIGDAVTGRDAMGLSSKRDENDDE